jgi:putative spermidine/putrescine transport system ATP-binding protein
MADRVGVMRSGNLEQIATPDELYAHPATPFAAEFVGIMNRIPGDMLEQLGGLETAAVTGGDDPARPINGMDALIRPEGLRITASHAGNGIVTTRTFLGQLTRISVRLSGDVVVQVDQRTLEAAEISPGDSVEVSLSGAPVLLAERNGATPAAVTPPGHAPAS